MIARANGKTELAVEHIMDAFELAPEERAELERRREVYRQFIDGMSAFAERVRQAARSMQHLMSSPGWRATILRVDRAERARAKAQARSRRNQPSIYGGAGVASYWYAPSTRNRKRNKHGRVGVRRAAS